MLRACVPLPWSGRRPGSIRQPSRRRAGGVVLVAVASRGGGHRPDLQRRLGPGFRSSLRSALPWSPSPSGVSSCQPIDGLATAAGPERGGILASVALPGSMPGGLWGWHPRPLNALYPHFRFPTGVFGKCLRMGQSDVFGAWRALERFWVVGGEKVRLGRLGCRRGRAGGIAGVF